MFRGEERSLESMMQTWIRILMKVEAEAKAEVKEEADVKETGNSFLTN